MKLKIITIIILLLLGLGSDYVLHHILPYSIIKPLRLNRDIQRMRLGNKTRPEAFGLKYSEINIKTRDSLWLKANHISPKAENRNITIIILHGIADTKESQTEKANFLAENGIAVMIPDLRAHGESGGYYCTYGYFEKFDIIEICKQLMVRNPNEIVGVWGTSLGGAIAIQAMGTDSSIRFGIIESTFDELEKVVDKYTRDLAFGLNLDIFSGMALKKAAEIADFEPGDVKPSEYSKRITRPVLFIHGDSDERIPLSYGWQNYINCGSAHKQWFTVKGGNHLDIWGKGGKNYRQKIIRFIDSASATK